MDDDTPVFLTPDRQAVLNGTYHGSDSTKRTHQSRIRSRAKRAIQELTAVAASSEINNADVFEPDDLARLIATIISPPNQEITPRWNYDGDPASYREKYEYPISVTWRLDHTIDGYADTLLRTDPPGESIEATDIDLIGDEPSSQK